MNKVVKWLKEKFSKNGRGENSTFSILHSQFNWLGVEVPPPIVRRYFERVEGETLDVPLAVARQVREETVALIARYTDADDRQVAVWQGIIAGMERFAAVYSRGVEMQIEKIGPGGQRVVKGLRQ